MRWELHELKTLRLALEALDRATGARNKIARYGTTYEDRWGKPQARPEVAIERDARMAYMKLMASLKFSEGEQSRQSGGRYAASNSALRVVS
jgi:hypothetical protein